MIGKNILRSRWGIELTHDELANDLANHLRSESVMVWTNLQLGPAPSPRPDVYTIHKSFANPRATSYECKVSVSDFRRDVTAGKWQSYLRYSCGVYFAAEEGLISKADVPQHCGLIIRYKSSGAWRHVKKAVLSPVVIPQDAWLKLLIDGVEREGPKYRARGYGDVRAAKAFNKKLGEVAARVIADRMSVERDIESAKRQAELIIQRAEQEATRIKDEAEMSELRQDLLLALGLESTASTWDIRRAVNTIRNDIKENPAQRRLKTLSHALRSVLERDGWKDADSIAEED